MRSRSAPTALTRLFDSIWYGGNPLKWLLWPLNLVFRGAMSVRRSLYRRGILAVRSFAVPVIVIGNVTAGGTGKTPCVIWLAAELHKRGYRPGIVCRGYRGKAAIWPQPVTADSDPAKVGDEAVLLARRARCPVVAGPDRVAAVTALLAQGGVDLVLSDDGLQHYAMARTVEIAVVDGTRGLGNGLCLPAGPLREPATRLREVDAIVVNGGTWGHRGVFRADVAVTAVRQTATGALKALADFDGQRVRAVAAIGNPQRFFSLLEDHGLDVEPHPLPDHAPIGPEELDRGDADIVMITEKDEVKCKAFADEHVWCVVVALEIAVQETQRFLNMLERQLDGVTA